MGEIRQRISAELKAAMKAREPNRRDTLRLIKSEILKAETAKGADDMNEEGLVKLLQTMKKQRLDSIDQFERGGRPELAEKERIELEIIETFLPKQLTDGELAALLDELIIETGAENIKDMGRVMKAALSRVAGRADGKRVSSLVKARLT